MPTQSQPHTYTYMSDVRIYVCKDCGAYAKSMGAVKHFNNCIPGISERWAKYYSQPDPKTEDEPNTCHTLVARYFPNIPNIPNVPNVLPIRKGDTE